MRFNIVECDVRNVVSFSKSNWTTLNNLFTDILHRFDLNRIVDFTFPIYD